MCLSISCCFSQTLPTFVWNRVVEMGSCPHSKMVYEFSWFLWRWKHGSTQESKMKPMYNWEGKKLNQNWLNITLITVKYYEVSSCTKSLPPRGSENLGKRLASLKQNHDLERLKLSTLRREPCWAGAGIWGYVKGSSWTYWKNFNVHLVAVSPWMYTERKGKLNKTNGKETGSGWFPLPSLQSCSQSLFKLPPPGRP